jgi:prolyl-tRNA editing enzyme YbaK/EbsC (Cys-tRNA(Pro) deacylase)
MNETLAAGAQRVQEALCRLGLTTEVIHMPQSTRTAQEAAKTIGCSVSQIIKSILFKGTSTGQPILVLACGSNRVNERIISQKVGEPVAKADAKFVREQSGFVIGGVPPLAHRVSPRTFIDGDLFQFKEAWAAAGTPFEVFRVTAPELQRITGGEVIRISDSEGDE